MPPLLTPQYWLSLNPTPFQPWAERLLLVVFGVFVLFGIITWIAEVNGGFSKPAKRALGRAASLLLWSGFVGLLLWVFAYERLPILSLRLFYLLWLAWVVYGFSRIYHFLWVEVPAKERMLAEREARERWLPRPKR